MTQVHLIHAVSGQLLESPVWSTAAQCLYLIDIAACELIRYVPDGETVTRWRLPSNPGAIALADKGGLIVALRSGIFHFDTTTAALTLISPPPYDPSTTRFNDGRVDTRGRFWIGSIYEPRDRADTSIYRLETDGRLHRVFDGFTTSNGLAFSPDGRTGYCADTPARKVWTFDIDPTTGAPSERRIFVDLQALNIDGRPDGATIDAEGCYWLALIDAGRVARFDPHGKLMQQIDLPVRWPTCPCFGGADLQTLYVANLRTGRAPDQLAASPDAGTLVGVRLPVSGLPEGIANLINIFPEGKAL